MEELTMTEGTDLSNNANIEKPDIINPSNENVLESNLHIGDSTLHTMEQNERILAEITDTVEGQLAKYDDKKKELEHIQNDLNELMERLNTFISDSQDDMSSGSEDGDDTEDVDNIESNDEKQDGQEKLQGSKISIDDMYVTDGTNPPEINWDTLAPFIQNIVGDLQKLRNLNNMTNNVVRRIRNVTESNVTMLDEDSVDTSENVTNNVDEELVTQDEKLT